MSWLVASKEVVKELAMFLLPERPSPVALAPVPSPLLLPENPKSNKAPEAKIETHKSTKPNILYAIKNNIRVWQRPVVALDGAVGQLGYGQAVLVHGFEGRFAKVEYSGAFGYVLKDDLEVLREVLFPTFFDGEIYNANHPDTKKLRRLIKDEFSTRELSLPLQSFEFVTFKLAESKRIIPWGNERPRVVGSWHTMLKGKSGVVMSITPKTGGLMEFVKADGSGWIGYTSAVAADDTITIQGVGRVIEGEYKEETFAKSDWHEWRPVWINVQ